ncbi:MAG TPA: metallophosphoesterase [Clostridiales bacterium]|nr:metallophosphoesterase [Clostridiales bacterium]
MHIMKYLYKEFLSLFNFPYIPEELINDIKGPILLHISDTPDGIYSYIFRIISILKPQFIVHTGDMVDNIKLEIYRSSIDCYRKSVAALIKGLENNESSKVYYVLGNHDDYETVSKLTERGTILEDGLLTINDCRITVSHYYKECLYESDFNLYGHNPDQVHYKNNDTTYLNGLLNINIIDLSNKRVFHLDYPVGTNRLRCMELKRIGL